MFFTQRQNRQFFPKIRPQWGPISAFYDRRDEDGSTHRTMETSQNKRADLPTSKASRPIAPLKPNEMQHSKEFPATQLRAVSNKSPFVRTGFQQKQIRQSPGLQHSMVAWRGFLSALRATRPLRLKPSGEFLKTAHRAVFLTEFHLIGSNPHNLTKNQNRPGNRLTCSIRW